jgi:hypothetical protein
VRASARRRSSGTRIDLLARRMVFPGGARDRRRPGRPAPPGARCLGGGASTQRRPVQRPPVRGGFDPWWQGPTAPSSSARPAAPFLCPIAPDARRTRTGQGPGSISRWSGAPSNRSRPLPLETRTKDRTGIWRLEPATRKGRARSRATTATRPKLIRGSSPAYGHVAVAVADHAHVERPRSRQRRTAFPLQCPTRKELGAGGTTQDCSLRVSRKGKAGSEVPPKSDPELFRARVWDSPATRTGCHPPHDLNARVPISTPCTRRRKRRRD